MLSSSSNQCPTRNKSPVRHHTNLRPMLVFEDATYRAVPFIWTSGYRPIEKVLKSTKKVTTEQTKEEGIKNSYVLLCQNQLAWCCCLFVPPGNGQWRIWWDNDGTRHETPQDEQKMKSLFVALGENKNPESRKDTVKGTGAKRLY